MTDSVELMAYVAADRGESTLTISAGFDTVIHTILSHLHDSFGVGGNTVMDQFVSEWAITVPVGSVSSTPFSCSCGVPQGSVLGSIIFTFHTSPIAGVTDACHMSKKKYADDTQVCGIH